MVWKQKHQHNVATIEAVNDTDYVLGRNCIKTTPLLLGYNYISFSAQVTCYAALNGTLHASCCDNSAENSVCCNLRH